MNLNQSIKISIAVILIIFTMSNIIISSICNNTANSKRESILAARSKIEITYENMLKTITQNIQVIKGEHKVFDEFKNFIISSERGQDLDVLLQQFMVTHPNFKVANFRHIKSLIEIKRNEFADVQNDYNDRVSQYNQYISLIIYKNYLDTTHKRMEYFVVSSKDTKQVMDTKIDTFNDLNL